MEHRETMYPTQVHYNRGSLEINQGTVGAKLETKIEQLMNQRESTGEPTAPLLYTAREQGVKASTDIRTDRWDIAVEATGKIARSYVARREERGKARQEEDKGPAENQRQEEKAKPEAKPTEGSQGKE